MEQGRVGCGRAWRDRTRAGRDRTGRTEQPGEGRVWRGREEQVWAGWVWAGRAVQHKAEPEKQAEQGGVGGWWGKGKGRAGKGVVGAQERGLYEDGKGQRGRRWVGVGGTEWSDTFDPQRSVSEWHPMKEKAHAPRPVHCV